MAKVPSYKEINAVIKKIADIPSKVDDEGFILADGVTLTKNTYDPKNGNYELHVRDKKNNKWKSFDTEDGADCVERAAKCFVDFYNAKHKSESRKPKCSMQKKKESLAKKNEADIDKSKREFDIAFKTGKDTVFEIDYYRCGDNAEPYFSTNATVYYPNHRGMSRGGQ